MVNVRFNIRFEEEMIELGGVYNFVDVVTSDDPGGGG